MLLALGVMGLAGGASMACSGSETGEAPSDPRAAAIAAYDAPESLAILPGSLRAFDVAPDGSFAEAEAWPSYQTKNWDWGDEGVHQPSNSGSAVEVEDLLSPGQVLTGIGARASENAVTRMRLRARSILSNWSWDPVGSTWQDWVRLPSDDGGNQAEMEIALQSPFVAVGVGMGISGHNIAAIRLRKREYSPSQHKLIGAESEDAVGTGAGELYWDTGFITQSADLKAKMVVVGVGLRELNDNLTTLRVWTAYLD
jgi:hypothetical protein